MATLYADPAAVLADAQSWDSAAWNGPTGQHRDVRERDWRPRHRAGKHRAGRPRRDRHARPDTGTRARWAPRLLIEATAVTRWDDVARWSRP